MLRLKNGFYALFLCLKYNRNYFLIKALDQTLIWLFNAGIIEHIYQIDKVKNFIVDSYEMERNLKIFSMDDLSFGFVVWLVSCAASCLAFLIEMNMTIVDKFRLKIVGLILLILLSRQRLSL
jgi:hypothetical protein